MWRMFMTQRACCVRALLTLARPLKKLNPPSWMQKLHRHLQETISWLDKLLLEITGFCFCLTSEFAKLHCWLQKLHMTSKFLMLLFRLHDFYTMNAQTYQAGMFNEKTLMNCIMGYVVSGGSVSLLWLCYIIHKLLQTSVKFNFPSVLLNSSVVFCRLVEKSPFLTAHTNCDVVC